MTGWTTQPERGSAGLLRAALWLLTRAGWRFGQALLRGDGARSRANEPLRRAYALASGLGAVPLTREIQALARAADLNLHEVARRTPQAGGRAASVLSEREREVLAHVDAGAVPHVLVLDLMMPVMDGASLLEELGARGLRERVRVVVATGVASPLVRRLVEANRYLFKPFDAGELRAAVAESCARALGA